MKLDKTLSPQDQVRKLLKTTFDDLQAKAPHYSLRAFARRLGMSSSALSEILNRKRTVTQKQAKRILEKLSFAPDLSTQILNRLENKKTTKLSKNGDTYTPLDMDQYHIVGEWYYYAILSLADTDNFSGDIEWISERLNLNKNTVKAALERLEKMELLSRDEKGNLKATGLKFTTSTDVVNLSLRKHHYQNLELAKKSLDEDPIDERDFSFMSMAVDPERLPEIKDRVREFRRGIVAEFETGRRSEVYKLCIQFFKLSKNIKDRR